MKTYFCKNCGTEHNVKGIQFANKYCNNKCQVEYQRKVRINQWINEGINPTGLQIPNWVKHYLSEKHGYKCSVCSLTDWHGEEIILECDHIDGNPHNNVPDNLRLICPNCHSQTHSFKGRNAGNGRTTRYKKADIA